MTDYLRFSLYGNQAPPVPTQHTKAQLQDIQCDLMLWCPEIKPTFDANGYDAELNLNLHSNDGHGDALGIAEGWMWTVLVPQYPAWKRQKAYAKAKSYGWTHFPLHVATLDVGPGYHGISPITPEWAAQVGAALNTVVQELMDPAVDLIPVAFGVSPDHPPSPGFDVTPIQVAVTDWDNTNFADSRIDAIAAAFPKAWLIYERPGPDAQIQPSADSHSQVIPTPDNGGEWIRSVQQRTNNRFYAMGFEVNLWEGLDQAAAEIDRCHAFYRDLVCQRLETDTYEKFWAGGNKADFDAANDQLQARCPYLSGYMSGGTPHPPPSDVHTDGHYLGELQGSDIEVVNAPDFRSWPVTTLLESVEVGLDDVHVVFSAQDTWPNVSFGIQYSLGICLKIDGVWYGCAPIELWKGKPGGGGPIQAQTVDGHPPGQIPVSWFYSPQRWGKMAGYQPKPGETIGVFVVAGDARNNDSPVQERSNIVLIPLPADGVAATFTPA